MNEILALDLATTTGWCRGAPGSIPKCGTERFAKYDGASHNAIFANALTFFAFFLKVDPRPTSIIIEALLPPQAMLGETSRKTRDLLAGLHGVVRGVAHSRGIYEIADVSVLAVRRHFCGDQKAKKEDVMAQCRRLGFSATTPDEADACATWHFACSLVKPELGIETTPLFGKRPMRVSV